MISYLTNEAKKLLEASDSERIAYIFKYRWIAYTNAEKIIERMEELFLYSKEVPRITSLLVVGQSNSGKTSIINRFKQLHPEYDFNIDRPANLPNDFFDTHTGAGIPIISIVAPAGPHETRLYSELLQALNAPYKERDSVDKKQHLVEHYIKLLNIEMLIIDEIHNTLSGSVAKQKEFFNAIKNLSNKLSIPIVLAGTKDALVAINTYDQIRSRFTPVFLPRWEADEELDILLATILSTFPLKKESPILDEKVIDRILDKTHGYLGNILELLRQAAKTAIYSGSEQISLTELESCDYRSPEQQMKDELVARL